jgi:peptide/nickel transport system permease protein
VTSATDLERDVAAADGLGTGRGRVLAGLRRSVPGRVGGVLLIVVVLAALAAPLLAPYPPDEVHFATPFQVPRTVRFALGTDDLGRDILSRILYRTRASLEVGVLAVLLALVVGVPLGLLAGWWHALDALISRLTDLLLAFPFLVIAVGITAVGGASLTGAAIALGVSQVPTMTLQQYIFRAPYAALFPGLAIVVICLAFNLFGDALRDVLQPGSRR